MIRLALDTNVLVALVDSRDGLHARAADDLAELGKHAMRVSSAVLTESVFALPRADQRRRLRLLLERLPIMPLEGQHEHAVRSDVFAWLDRYSEHDPDYADAELCVLAGRDARLRIWTYDREFRTVWRTPRGKRPSIVGG